MKLRVWFAIAAGLLLSGCALLRHDAVVRGAFPEDSAFEQGVVVTEAWAQ